MKKVFVTGLSKTSTKSMTNFLNTSCKINIHHYPINDNLINRAIKNPSEENLKYISKIDGMSDIQVCAIYKELDKAFNAVFIHTFRDYESWIESYKKHISIRPTPKKKSMKGYLREKVYGTTSLDISSLRSSFEKYEIEIRKYFTNKENFLAIHINEEKKEEKIYNFLIKNNIKVYKEITYPWIGKSKKWKEGQ